MINLNLLAFLMPGFQLLVLLANELATASLNINFPVDTFSLPVTYKDLTVTSLVVEGKETGG